jgi:hypothetical protein
MVLPHRSYVFLPRLQEMSRETVLAVKVMTRKRKPQGFYMNPLVIDNPCTTHASVSEANACTEDDDDCDYVENHLADGEVESHHGLYWRRDGVLEEPQCKMPKTRG